MSLTVSNSETFIAGKDQVRSSESFIYINGVLNSRKNAQDTCAQISRMTGTRIVLFYNPTPSKEDTSDMDRLINRLANLIIRERLRCKFDAGKPKRSPRILILAHSHGSVLLAGAMKREDVVELKDEIEIATFGAAEILPSNLARKVQNFVNESDPIPSFTNIPTGCAPLDFLQDDIGRKLRFSGYKNPELRERFELARFDLLAQKNINVEMWISQLIYIMTKAFFKDPNMGTRFSQEGNRLSQIVDTYHLELLEEEVRYDKPISAHAITAYFKKIAHIFLMFRFFH